MSNEGIKPRIISEAKRIEEDCLYSSKGHFNSAQLWTDIHYWIGVPTVIAAALAGVSAWNKAPEIAIFLSLLVTAATAVITFLNPNEKATMHHNAGVSYAVLRSDTRIFAEIEAPQGDDKILTEKLHLLTERRNKLNDDSLQIPRWAYNKAKQGIESGEATYQADIRRK